MERIYFIGYQRMDGRMNMEIDEVLFKEICVKRKESGFRLFGWDGEWVSFGRNQKPPSTSIPSVRRPTGGGIVFHKEDTSFSFFISKVSSLWSFNPMRVYLRITNLIKESLEKLGFEISYSHSKEKSGTDYCFERALPHELVMRDKKIMGCSLVKRKEGILGQGTIMLKFEISEFEETLKSLLKEMGFEVVDCEVNSLRNQ